MWVGSGEHYSFGNQIEAARRNWVTLVRSLEPLLDATSASRRAVDAALHDFADEARQAEEKMWAAKLGFCRTNDLLRYADWTNVTYRSSLGDGNGDPACLP